MSSAGAAAADAATRGIPLITNAVSDQSQQLQMASDVVAEAQVRCASVEGEYE